MRRGTSLGEGTLLTPVNNSNVPDDLPLSVCEGALPCTSERLAFSFFRGAFLPFATRNHLPFPSSGVLSFPLRPQLTSEPLEFSLFRGAFLPSATAAHLGTTCLFLLPGCFPSLCDRSSPRNYLNFLSSGVLSFPLRPQLTSEPLAFSFFRGAFLPSATAAHLGTT